MTTKAFVLGSETNLSGFPQSSHSLNSNRFFSVCFSCSLQLFIFNILGKHTTHIEKYTLYINSLMNSQFPGQKPDSQHSGAPSLSHHCPPRVSLSWFRQDRFVRLVFVLCVLRSHSLGSFVLAPLTQRYVCEIIHIVAGPYCFFCFTFLRFPIARVYRVLLIYSVIDGTLRSFPFWTIADMASMSLQDLSFGFHICTWLLTIHLQV